MRIKNNKRELGKINDYKGKVIQRKGESFKS